MTHVIELADVTKTYAMGDQVVRALDHVTVAFAEDDFCAIRGPSGSGKSTLMNIAGLLDRACSGQVRIEGRDVSQISADDAADLRNRLIGFVFQSFQLLPRLTAWENVALPLVYRGVGRAERRIRSMDMLDQVGLAARADHRPDDLSGGQRQRIAIARALIGSPRLILADEPTGNLDSGTAGEMLDLLAGLNRRIGVAVLIVTHDPEVGRRCRRELEIVDGRLVGDRRGRACEPS